MNGFSSIDPILSAWAADNSTHWFTEYQDVEVRTLFMGKDRRDRVQIAVDAPQGVETVVRVYQNRRGLSRLHRSKNLATSIGRLSVALDHAVRLAEKWLIEDSQS